MIGTDLSHFHITAKLGEGGMGEVYQAEDRRLGRQVAIKVLPEDLVNDTERLERFEREARLLASLRHPSIAALYDVGEAVASQRGTGDELARPVRYLVMELVPGMTLAERLAHGPLSLDETLRIAAEIAAALEFRDRNHMQLLDLELIEEQLEELLGPTTG